MLLPYAGRVLHLVGAGKAGAIGRRAVVLPAVKPAARVSGVGEALPVAVLPIGAPGAARKSFV